MANKGMSDQLKTTVFGFLFWFSRFEFAFKERRYWKSGNPGKSAKVDGPRFIREQKDRRCHVSATAEQFVK